MLKFCPVLSGDGHTRECWHERCEFADTEGNCLIVEALQCYIAKERTEAARRKSIEDIYRNAGYTMRSHKGEK